MIDFKKASYTLSLPSILLRPKDGLPSILFIGRSNVGKSTLINSLTGQNHLAFSSKKAGKTKLLSFFLIDDTFYLLDAPGYGKTLYANVSTINFAKMMEEYIEEPSSKGIVYLLDLRHPLGEEDLSFLHYLQKSKLPLVYVVTKVDTMNQKEKAMAQKLAREYQIPNPIYSDGKKNSIEEIKKAITSLLNKK